MKDSETTTEERVTLSDVSDPAFLPINLFQFSVSTLQFGTWGYDSDEAGVHLVDKLPHYAGSDEEYTLHPAVKRMLYEGWRPRGYVQLALEAPSIASDGVRVAYTREESHWEAGRRTVTSIGKYLSRHFSAPDHVIRDCAALVENGKPILLHSVRDFVHAVTFGPPSCMQWDYDFEAADDANYYDDHPYAVYGPEFGWRMAIRKEGSKVVARALWLHESRGPWKADETLSGVFVRTYLTSDSYSQSDTALEAWFKSVGIAKARAWPDGARLRKLPWDHADFMAPYIDGEHGNVFMRRDHLVIDEDGDYSCRDTGGAPEHNARRECEHCGNMRDEDDFTSVGYHGNAQVCSECIGEEFTWVLGRNRRHYYVHNDDVGEIASTGQSFDINYAGDLDIVTLDDDTYEFESNAFCCAITDRWYAYEDGVQTEDAGWVHVDQAWQCTGSGDWYSTNEKPIDAWGDLYHEEALDLQDDGSWKVRPRPVVRCDHTPDMFGSERAWVRPEPGDVVWIESGADLVDYAYSWYEQGMGRFVGRLAVVDSVTWNEHGVTLLDPLTGDGLEYKWDVRRLTRVDPEHFVARACKMSYSTGAPPSVGWWLCVDRFSSRGTRAGDHGLWRYWNGEWWSRDVFGDATEEHRTAQMYICAATPQGEIRHYPILAPWEKKRVYLHHVAPQCKYRPGDNGHYQVFNLRGDATWTTDLRGGRNEELTSPIQSFVLESERVAEAA